MGRWGWAVKLWVPAPAFFSASTIIIMQPTSTVPLTCARNCCSTQWGIGSALKRINFEHLIQFRHKALRSVIECTAAPGQRPAASLATGPVNIMEAGRPLCDSWAQQGLNSAI